MFAALLGGLFAVPLPAVGQDGASGHAGHHPGADAGPASASDTPAPAVAMPGGGMGGMMGGGMGGPEAATAPPSASPAMPAPQGTAAEMGDGPNRAMPSSGSGAASGAGCGAGGCMGGGGAKPFFPALMDMPSLTPNARRFILTEAGRRLGIGSEAITRGQAPLHDALLANDAAAMQQAAGDLREGVLLVESGASALRAVNEGQPPRQIALNWFKTRTSVPIDEGMVTDGGPWGLTWYHVILMAFLAAFLLGAILIHYARLRRISGLVQRLAPGGGAAKPPAVAGAAPEAAAAKPPAAPRATPPADAAPAANKTWSGALRVAAIFRETPHVKTFRLTSLDGENIPFTYLPGQFLTFSAKIDDKPIKRSYTIASSPAQRGYVEITVKREEKGAESRYLHDQIAVGDHLDIFGPAGVFTFTGEETDSIVMISGGVGITPMMCVLRCLTDRGYLGDIFFLHGSSAVAELIFREELAYLERRHDNLHVSITVADFEDASWQGPMGAVSKEFIAGSVPDIARRRVHLCGPPAMMEAVKADLVELGVAKDKIKTESFGAALGAAPAPTTASPAPAPAPATAPAAPVGPPAPPAGDAKSGGPPAAPGAGQVEVQFSKSGITGALASNQCVLEAAEAIGVAIDFSCRVGTCGTCAVPLTSGTVTMAEESGLPPADKARGIILACQAKSTGDLVVDA